MDFLSNSFDNLHEWLVQHMLLPVLYQLGWMNFAEESDIVVDWVIFGVIQILVIAFILHPLEKNELHFISAKDENFENWSQASVASTRIDILYSFIHRLGLYQFFFFYCFSGLFFWVGSGLHDLGFERQNVENWIPGWTSIPLVSFIIYLILFDALDYGYHRLSHRFQWWWQLHSLHHSQRHMSAWSDNRNHLLDDVMRSFVFASFAMWIGVEPSQFLNLIVMSRLIQSWQHGFYPGDVGFLKYLVVTPHFHRYHHAIGLGYEVPGKSGVLGGCNFGVLFPWWDILLGTAVFDSRYYPSGVKDFDPPNQFFTQQWLCIKRSIRFLNPLR
jgi:sterol desaturase/sphingolipid hydroxylase (fatty acid hydroxylase superfamily)